MTFEGEALGNITVDAIKRGFQVNDTTNPLVGATARTEILQRLGASFMRLQDVFGPSGRPGNLVGMLLLILAHAHSSSDNSSNLILSQTTSLSRAAEQPSTTATCGAPCKGPSFPSGLAIAHASTGNPSETHGHSRS